MPLLQQLRLQELHCISSNGLQLQDLLCCSSSCSLCCCVLLLLSLRGCCQLLL
jgi:hypothetical protein